LILFFFSNPPTNNVQQIREIKLQDNKIQGQEELILQKTDSLIQFLLACANDKLVPYTEIKLMVVGECAAGKTTLVQVLGGSKSHDPPGSTDGIDLGVLRFGAFDFSVWDFGGQVKFLSFFFFFFFDFLILISIKISE
jgi:ADP-ribosylation factor family